MDAALVARQVEDRIHVLFPNWKVSALTPHAAGLDTLVCRAESPAIGTLAIKIPWTRAISNDNDPDQDSRMLLRQEEALARWARGAHVPAPVVHALAIDDEGRDFLASQFVPTDGTGAHGDELGRLVRAIHDAPAYEGALVGQTERTCAETLAARLGTRAETLARAALVPMRLPGHDALVRLLSPPARPRAVLHMDIRPANLLVRGGRVIGVVDWANALVGDPAIELARIAEYGHLDDAFVRGYGREPWAGMPRTAELLYRLDTAIMLAIVFHSEAPDPGQAAVKLARVRELIGELEATGAYVEG
jgi:aminoglycoside phosphotransferase (APT) family kinase protein